MEIILKHLDGDEQYRFLQMFLDGIVPSEKLPETIRKIMEEINKDENA